MALLGLISSRYSTLSSDHACIFACWWPILSHDELWCNYSYVCCIHICHTSIQIICHNMVGLPYWCFSSCLTLSTSLSSMIEFHLDIATNQLINARVLVPWWLMNFNHRNNFFLALSVDDQLTISLRMLLYCHLYENTLEGKKIKFGPVSNYTNITILYPSP